MPSTAKNQNLWDESQEKKKLNGYTDKVNIIKNKGKVNKDKRVDSTHVQWVLSGSQGN